MAGPDPAGVTGGFGRVRAVARATLTRVREEQVSLAAAGVAFYLLLATVPALVATVSVYGLVADPSDVQRQVDATLGALPVEARSLVTSQLQSITSGSRSGVGVGFVVGLLAALWGTSAAVRALLAGVHRAWGEAETRSGLRLRLLALLLALGGVVFVSLLVGLVAALPALMARVGLGHGARVAIGLLRWPVLIALMFSGLAVLYRLGPDRARAGRRPISWGAGVAVVVWMVGSVAFSVYVGGYSSYSQTYGALGAVVVFMLWAYLSALAVLLGATVDATLAQGSGGGPAPEAR